MGRHREHDLLGGCPVKDADLPVRLLEWGTYHDRAVEEIKRKRRDRAKAKGRPEATDRAVSLGFVAVSTTLAGPFSDFFAALPERSRPFADAYLVRVLQHVGLNDPSGGTVRVPESLWGPAILSRAWHYVKPAEGAAVRRALLSSGIGTTEPATTPETMPAGAPAPAPAVGPAGAHGLASTGLDSTEAEAETPPPASAPAEDPRRLPEAASAGPRLGAGQRANLLPSCINMREGGWAKWEAPLARLLGDGVTADEINAHLSGTPKALPAWKALRPFEDRLAASVPKPGSTNGKQYPAGTRVNWKEPA